jgi:hypothetical protein
MKCKIPKHCNMYPVTTRQNCTTPKFSYIISGIHVAGSHNAIRTFTQISRLTVFKKINTVLYYEAKKKKQNHASVWVRAVNVENTTGHTHAYRFRTRLVYVAVFFFNFNLIQTFKAQPKQFGYSTQNCLKLWR